MHKLIIFYFIVQGGWLFGGLGGIMLFILEGTNNGGGENAGIVSVGGLNMGIEPVIENC